MRFLYKILIVLFVIGIFNTVNSQTVINTLTNFTITGGNKFSFDIYTLRTSIPDFRMGSSSYFIQYTAGTLANPVLSNVNPKYTLGSPTNSYLPMVSTSPFPTTTTAVQVLYDPLGGIGDVITNIPGPSGNGERIATVTLDILMPVAVVVQWDTLNSAVVNPSFITATSSWRGVHTGILPVELSSFTSSIVRNNVTLNWITSSEVNNNGFDVERKAKNDNSDWSKIGFVNGSGNSHESKTYAYNDNGLSIGKYNYRLKQIDFNGNFKYYELQGDVQVGVPTQFELSQNFPNPFNPSTKINFALPVDTKLTLNLYDISGRLVSTLINNELRAANYYTVVFNGSNLSSGTYFYTIRSDKFNETKKMVLIK